MAELDRDEAIAELARRIGDHVLERGLVRVKLLLVDAGGDRQLIALGPPDWKLEPRAPNGELLFLEAVQLVGVEPAERAD